MGTATITRAEFLKNPERFEVAEDAAVKNRWGADAKEAVQSSLLTDQIRAAVHAALQQAITGQALAFDVVTVSGIRQDLEGQTITITCARYDYRGGKLFMVTGAVVDLENNRTTLEGYIQL